MSRSRVFRITICVSILSLLVVLLMPLFAQPLLAQGEPVNIRVKVGQGSSFSFSVVSGAYQLVDGSSGLPIIAPAAGESWQVVPVGTSFQLIQSGTALATPYIGPIILTPSDPAQENIYSLVFNGKSTKYRGILSLNNVNGSLVAVDILDAEKYVSGVIGLEIGSAAGDEALKAQAVVARTYVMSYLGKGTVYDVTNTTVHQVFGGYSAESPKVIQAVSSTAGQVIEYDGKLIQAYFHSNAGGYTESSENVWNVSLPYLKATPTPEDSYAQEVGGWPASTYSWTKNISRSDLNSMVLEWNADHPDDRIDVGTITGFELSRLQRYADVPTESGRVTKITFLGTNGTEPFYRDRIRTVLGLKSTLFDISLDSAVSVIGGSGTITTLNGLQGLLALAKDTRPATPNGSESSYYIVGAEGVQRSLPKLFQNAAITGKGYGHGLGLSQWGARGLAEKGYNYRQIIEHYYNRDKFDGHLQIADNYGR